MARAHSTCPTIPGQQDAHLLCCLAHRLAISFICSRSTGLTFALVTFVIRWNMAEIRTAHCKAFFRSEAFLLPVCTQLSTDGFFSLIYAIKLQQKHSRLAT